MPPLADGSAPLSRRNFLRLVALSSIATVGLLDGCTLRLPLVPGAGPTAPAMARPERVLTVATLGDVGTFDPFNVSDITAPVVRNLYNTLIRLEPTRRAIPELAEQWSVAGDGRTLLIQLRAGVKFHNGRNLNAEDLQANLDRARDWQRGLHLHDFATGIKSVEVKDRYTAAVHFHEPSPMMLDLMDVLAVGDPGTFRDFTERDGGTGCFWLAERVPAHHVTLKRFDSYWLPGRPLLDRVVIKFFSDEEAILAGLDDGSVDLASGLATAAGSATVAVERIPMPRGLHVLVLNPSRSPFDRREVRQAVQWAIDRRALAAETLAGAVDPSTSFFPNSSPAYDADLARAVGFDPERARGLLGSSPAASDKPTLLVGQHEPAWGRIAEVLNRWLEPIGLPLEVWQAPVGQWFAALSGGNFHAALASLDFAGRYPSAIAWNLPLRLTMNPLWPGGLPAAYADAVKAAATTLDEGRQRQAWRAMQQALLDEAWVIPLAWHYHHVAARRPLDGLAWTIARQLLLQDAALRP